VFEFEPYSNTIGKYISLFDIGIAPLTFCQFNRGKSRAKILEYSLCGVPSIATDIEPYNRDAENDPTILVKDNDPYEWFRQLERLVLDRGLREDLGRRSREYVLANYSIKDQASKWADVILDLAAEARKAKCDTIEAKAGK
jgi:glycosyltransferase involved in cell wall biosynthesis